MRVAFIGKGGSGKTTISSLFAQQSAADAFRVLAFDADINQHLSAALGFETMPRSMGEHLDEIKAHLVGKNERVGVESMQKTTPPGTGSHLVTLADDDWFMRTFTTEHDGVRLAGAGEVPSANVGVKCFHGLNGGVELVLGHMIDQPDDIVIVDMTAGADVLSSTLFAKVDALVIVVEPTLKSLSVYEQIKPHTDAYGIPLYVVANKIIDHTDLDFIRSKVGDVCVSVSSSAFVRQRERGEILPIAKLDEKTSDALRRLRMQLLTLPRDWSALERRSHELHRKNAESWMGSDALAQIDPDFSLESVARHHM